MRLLAYVPIKLTLLLILGILIGHFFSIALYFSLVFVILCIIALGYFFFQKKNKGPSFEIVTAITVIAIGIFVILNAQPKNHANFFGHLNSDEYPILKVKIRETLKPSAYSLNYLAEVITLDDQKAHGKILLNSPLDSTRPSLTVDDELVIRSGINNIKPPLNPHQFDYKKYMERLGVYHQVRLTNQNHVLLPPASRTIVGYAQQLRSHIIETLRKENFGTEQLAIVQALLLGERSQISDDTYSNYIDAGAVHILAVSGLHIGVLLFLIQFLLRPLKSLPKGDFIMLIATLVLLWGFAFIAGFSPSIIRACAMFSFVAYAMYLNRPTNSFNILALSMFFVLLTIDPKLLFQVGFQMSYAAVFAIVLIYPLLQQLWFPKNKVLRYLWQLLSVSIAAQLGVLPISLFYFHQFPGLFFISNLLIVPFLALILGMGVLIIFLSLLDVAPGKLIWLYNEIIGLMNTIISWVAHQESFILRSISFDGVQLILGFLLIGAMVYCLTRLNFKSIASFLACLFLFQIYSISREYLADQKHEAIILHQVKNSILLNRNGATLKVLTHDSLNAQRLLGSYKVEERINQTKYFPLKNSYKKGTQRLQVIDSCGVYPNNGVQAIYLLTQSPKINLERFILKTRPRKIIVDGSNYPSFVERWEQTCIQHKIPFYYTGKMGFYKFTK